MKTVQFKQHNSQKVILVAVLYLLVMFSAAWFWFGGIDGMADKVNSIGSAKGAGFIVGIIVLVPFFVLLRFFQPNVNVDIDPQKIIIREKGKQDMIIHFNAINRIELHTKKINRLDIYDKQNNLLSYLHPVSNPELLQPLIREIVTATGFRSHKKQIKIIGRSMEAMIYSNDIL